MEKVVESEAFSGIDPMEIMVRRERRELRQRAREIAKLPEHLWVEKVNLEPPDRQETIWFFLKAIRTVRTLRW
jgi:hypothetical protein